MNASQDGPYILEVRDLVKDFDGLRAINGCSFGVKEGTITGLIGPNGAGKTTLFNVITGYFMPDSGQVLADGQDVTALPPDGIYPQPNWRNVHIPPQHETRHRPRERDVG